MDKQQLKNMTAAERAKLMAALQDTQATEASGGAPYVFCTHTKSWAADKGAALIAKAQQDHGLNLKFVSENKASKSGFISCFAADSPVTGLTPRAYSINGNEIFLYPLDSEHYDEIGAALRERLVQPFPKLQGGTKFTKEQMQKILEEGAMVLTDQGLVLERQAEETAFNIKNTSPLIAQFLGNKVGTTAFSKVQDWLRSGEEKKILADIKKTIAKEKDPKVREKLQKDFDEKDQKEMREQVVETALILGSTVFVFLEARKAVNDFASLGPDLQEILKGHIAPIKQQLNALLNSLLKMVSNLKERKPVEFLARLTQMIVELDALLSAIAGAQEYLANYIKKLDKYKETAERIRQEEKWMIGLDLGVVAWHAIVNRSFKIPDAARLICAGTRLYNIIEQGRLLAGVDYHMNLAREYLQVMRSLYALLNDDNDAALKGRLKKMSANKGKLTAAEVEWEVIQIEWIEPLEEAHKSIAEQVAILDSLQKKPLGAAGVASTATAAAGTASKKMK